MPFSSIKPQYFVMDLRYRFAQHFRNQAKELKMRTRVCEMFGIELPIFAFSHCRDVVVEVSKAGGMGVLGASGFSREHLDQELKWIDTHIDGKPYGIDLLVPNRYEKVKLPQRLDPTRLLPSRHVEFTRSLLDNAGVPALPESDRQAILDEYAARINMTPEEAEGLIDVALKHPLKLVVSALGVAPKHLIDHIHAHGVKVGALVGKLDHATHQRDAGIDLLIAQGSEAGGHTGKISSMVLWPQIVDAVAPLPVLAAGGIGRGRQFAAAMALGAEGIWCGSIWLGTRQSELTPEMKARFFAARSDDAVQTRALTGKPCRALKSQLTEAWEKPDAPKPLPMPLQTILMGESMKRVERVRDSRFLTYPVGQIVGDMRSETTCRQVVEDMLGEFIEATERLGELLGNVR